MHQRGTRRPDRRRRAGTRAREHRLGGPRRRYGAAPCQVVAGHELGTRRLQDAQLPAQRGEFGLRRCGRARRRTGEPASDGPRSARRCRRGSRWLALVVHDLRRRQPPDGRHGPDQALRVATVEPGALPYPSCSRNPTVADVALESRISMVDVVENSRDGARERTEDLRGAPTRAQQEDERVRQAGAQCRGADLEHRVGVARGPPVAAANSRMRVS